MNFDISLIAKLQNSHHSLCHDFNHLFEDLLNRIETQRSEANLLRQQLARASELAVKSNLETSSKIESVLQEERARAASDRQSLLVQITDLVMKLGESQDTRLNAKISEIKKDVTASKETFDQSKITYEKDLRVLNHQEENLLAEVSRSHVALSNKLEEGWLVRKISIWCHSLLTSYLQVTDEKNNRLCDAAKSVHNQTIRIVDSKIHDIENQMKALDDLVTEAKVKNTQHYCDDEKLFDSLSTATLSSFSKINSRFNSINDCVRHLNENIGSKTKLIQESLEPLDSTLNHPLVQLRKTICGMHLKEYQVTGQTPQKVQYHFPTVLPQTENHEVLLNSHCESTELFCSKKNPVITKSSGSNQETLLSSSQSPPAISHSPSQHANLSAKSPVRLREMDVNISQVSSLHINNDEKIPDEPNSKKGTREKRNRRNPGKLPVLKEIKGPIYLDGRENLGDNVAASSTLMMSLDTRRRRSPRIES